MVIPFSFWINNFQFNEQEADDRIKILYELSWLWETLGIALVAAAVCMACAALIGKAEEETRQKGVGGRRGSGICGAILAVILDRLDNDALFDRLLGIE